MRFPGMTAGIAAALALLTGCNPGPPRPFAVLPEAPYLIFDPHARTYVALSTAADELARADVVFFGEFHEDEAAHIAELDLMRELAARRQRLILGLEMFERDVQEGLDDYLAGNLSEADFMGRTRPWPNYVEAYRPLVEFARQEGWPVYATNLPQPLASAIARGGLAALDQLPPDQRRLAAAEADCSIGPYWDRFIGAIVETADSSGHMAGAADDPMFRPMFEAQCSRDEAMAETIASIAGEGPLVYHVNGAFHSDFRLGTVSRLMRRRPDLRVMVVSALPEEDREREIEDEDPSRADYFILTP